MDRSVVGWRVWYDGGRTFDSRTMQWADLPDDGLQVMVVYYANGNRSMESGNDIYFEAPGKSGGLIYGSSLEPKRHILVRYPKAIVKKGRWTTYQEITDQQDIAEKVTESP